MYLKCIECGKIKKISSFPKNQTRCKICINNKIRKEVVKDDLGFGPRLTPLTKKDFCNTYKLLMLMGYNIDGDVHEQFTKKYGLPYKERPLLNTLKYLPKDCLDGSDKADLPTS